MWRKGPSCAVGGDADGAAVVGNSRGLRKPKLGRRGTRQFRAWDSPGGGDPGSLQRPLQSRIRRRTVAAAEMRVPPRASADGSVDEENVMHARAGLRLGLRKGDLIGRGNAGGAWACE